MAKSTKGKKKVYKKKEKKNIPAGIVHISASFNNTLISITDPDGNLIAQSSAGAKGFRGSRKGTPFAAQQSDNPLAFADTGNLYLPGQAEVVCHRHADGERSCLR